MALNKVKLRRNFLKLLGLGTIILGGILSFFAKDILSTKPSLPTTTQPKTYMLPMPKFSSNMMLEKALACRRSIRDYLDVPIPLDALSMILWAAQGVTEFNYGFRTCPSAGGTYPLEVYAVVGKECVMIEDGKFLPEGSYKYNCKTHSITMVKDQDLREPLSKASLGQYWVRDARINIVVCAVYERTTGRYGDRGYKYVYMEDGHVGQNIYLMAAALRLGTVAIGAFYDDEVKNVIGAQDNEHPLYVMPIGVPRHFYEINEADISKYYTRIRGQQ
ncbi:MAG: SagB/ThcOx family dehydrogenase [Nitrososphaeria archaeon]|nr:SagB/ThcOx family dehydrogenase [Nitrososphaeria archaeon]